MSSVSSLAGWLNIRPYANMDMLKSERQPYRPVPARLRFLMRHVGEKSILKKVVLRSTFPKVVRSSFKELTQLLSETV